MDAVMSSPEAISNLKVVARGFTLQFLRSKVLCLHKSVFIVLMTHSLFLFV